MAKRAGVGAACVAMVGLCLLAAQGCVPKADAVVAEARALESQRKHTEAIKVCDDYLGEYKGSPWASEVAAISKSCLAKLNAMVNECATQARALAREKRFDEACAYVDDFAAKHPELASRVTSLKVGFRAIENDWIDEQIQQARDLASQRKYQDALKAVDALLAKHPARKGQLAPMKVAYTVMASD